MGARTLHGQRRSATPSRRLRADRAPAFFRLRSRRRLRPKSRTGNEGIEPCCKLRCAGVSTYHCNGKDRPDSRQPCSQSHGLLLQEGGTVRRKCDRNPSLRTGNDEFRSPRINTSTRGRTPAGRAWKLSTARKKSIEELAQDSAESFF